MEGKEVRFGITDSGALRGQYDGNLNAARSIALHDSYTPIGGLVPITLIDLGEMVFGGVGAGLYSMLYFAIIAVFIAGLMVGRTPEYLGKKIERKEIMMAALALLLSPLLVLASPPCPGRTGWPGWYRLTRAAWSHRSTLCLSLRQTVITARPWPDSAAIPRTVTGRLASLC